MQGSSYDFNDPRLAPMNSSPTIYLATWLTGSTGFLLSILALVMQWFLPFDLVAPINIPKKLKREPQTLPASPPLSSVPLPTQVTVQITSTRPTADRHVSFSLGPETKDPSTSQKIRFAPPPCLESLRSPGSSIHSAESATLVTTPSPCVSSVDLPPLENMPLLPFDPEILPVKTKGLPGLGPPPVSFMNPFKSRRWSSSSSSKVTSSPVLQEIPASPDVSENSNQDYFSLKGDSKRSSLAKCFGMKGPRSSSSSRNSSSAPTTPIVSTVTLRSSSRPRHNTSASVSSIDFSSPVTTPPQGRKSLSTFINLGRSPRSGSPKPLTSPKPLRTQPYGAPYFCPPPRPTSRSSHRKPTSVSNVTSQSKRGDGLCVDLT